MRAQRGLASSLLGLSASILLVACGGGGGGGGGNGGGATPPTNRAPSANAGIDQTIRRNAIVTLDGSASTDADNDALAYRWVQTEGTPVTLSSATSSQPTFTAPGQSGALTFALITNDGKIDSTADSVTINVANAAPTAVSAPSMAVGLGQMAILDGTRSSDADGDSLTYTWTQLSGPIVEISPVSNGISEFRVPYMPAVFVFSLVVSDGEATSVTINITINVTVEATPALPPIVSAGWDRNVPRRSTVVLNGSAWDPNYDFPLTYTWEQVAGPSVTLTNPNSTSPTFTAPETPAELRFALRASDGRLSSEADEVVINVQNFMPGVYNAGITPTNAYTTDTLVADAQVTDADGDTITATYEWRRNGTLIASETSSTFPASLTTRNDVISVRMSFDDGLEQTIVDASTIIRDSPAVLTAQTPPPTSLNYGDTASFTVTAVDADGDAIPGYEVAFGPAGFSVTPQGDVSWTAAGALFDRVTDFNWGVRVTGDASSLLAGTFEVTDATRVYPLRRTNLSIPVQHSGLKIGDLDADGDREVLVGSPQAVYILSRSGGVYQQSWVYPFDVGTPDLYGSTVQAVTAADITGDNRQEIFFSKGGELVRLDGISRRKVASAEAGCRALEIADLEGNGSLELICLAVGGSYQSGGSIRVLNPATLAEIWSTPPLAVGNAMAIGNVDNDAALEIVVAGGFVYDGGSRQNQWAYSEPFGNAVDTGDMDGDGVEEIIGMVTWSAVRAFSAVHRSPLWEYVPSFRDLGALTVADANGDGRVEAIAANNQLGVVMGIGYNTSTHQPELLWQIGTQSSGVSSIAVGDVDGDGGREVVWGAGSGDSGRDELVVAGFSPTISLEWRSSSVAELNGPFYGGQLARIGAGDTRLMFGVARSDSGYSGTRVIALTPMTGEVESTRELGTNWAVSGGFTVADYDNDNIDEMLMGSASLYDGYFAAYDFAADSVEWQSPQFHHQSGLAVRSADMNGDGHADLIGLTSGGYLEIHDIHAQSLLWRSTQLGGAVALALGDLDSDGEQEMVVAVQNRLIVYGRAPLGTTYLERASITHTGATDVLVADLNGDATPEIYMLGGEYFYGNSTLKVYDADLQLLRSMDVGARGAAIFVEKSSFARKNLLLAISGDQYGSNPSHAELWAIDPVTAADVWRSPALGGTVTRNSLEFVDVNGDGDDEIVFGTQWGMHHTR